MKVGLLARLILCCSILFYVSMAASEDISIIRKPKDIDKETLKEVEDAVKGFQSPSNIDQLQGILKKQKEITTAENTKKILKDMLPAVAGDIKTPAVQKAPSESPKKDGQEVYVLISFSMPKQSIQNLIKDAVKLNKESSKNIVLVLKGFIDGDLKATIKELYNITKDKGFLEGVPLEIDPNKFDGVKEVPIFISSNGKLNGKLKGDVGLKFVLSKFDSELKDHGKYGNTYTVIEKDISEVIAQKQPEIEKRLQDKVKEIRKRAYIVSGFDGKFQHAKKDRTYYINPNIVLSNDIKDHTGKVLFPKGSIYKPSDYVSLGRYIIIDGSSNEQVKLALKDDYRKIIIIKGDIEELIKKYKRRFYAANETILEKFQIEKVPAIIEQEGDRIRVTEKAVN